MAIKRKSAGGTVTLEANETIIGVSLEREIQDSVKVRPTNVTATLDISNHDASGLSHPLLQYTESGGVVNPSATTLTFTGTSIGATTFAAGDRVLVKNILVSGLAVYARYINFETTVTASGAGTVTVNAPAAVDLGISTAFTIVAGTNNAAIVDLEEYDEDLIILLHNGPAGGFTQQARVAAGEYIVNEVIKAVITDA